MELTLIVIAVFASGVLFGTWFGYVFGIRDAEKYLAVELQDALGPDELRGGGAI